MEIRTRLFQLKLEYSPQQLALILGFSQSQVYRVKQGKRRVSADFIAKALTAFPEYKFEELFYIKRKY